MSVWTDVEGTVFIRKDSGFSFRTYIVDHFMEAEPKMEQQLSSGSTLRVDFKFCFSDSNLSAANALQNFVNTIKEYDRNSYVDIYSQLRFLG